MEPVVLGMGYPQGETGWAIHTRHFYRALGQRVYVVPVDLQRGEAHAQQALVEFGRAVQKPGVSPVMMVLGHGTDMGPLASPLKTVGYTVFERTKLAPDWIRSLQIPTQVWVPSSWAKKVLVENGIAEARIRIVPEGVDPRVFNPDGDLDESTRAIGGFRFLMIGKWEARKNIDGLVRAFGEEFRDDSDVHLLLYVHNPFRAVSEDAVRSEIAALAGKAASRVHVHTTGLPTQVGIASIYRSCHAFVFPSRAEGWGLPLMEAMACGLPSIATYYSGMTEFLAEDNAYLLDYELIDIDPDRFPTGGFPAGVWAEPNPKTLAAQMREVVTHYEKAREKGARAAAMVKERFTWSHAATTAANHLRELVSAP